MYHRSRVPRIAGGKQDVEEDKTKLCGSVYTILCDIKSLLPTALIIYFCVPGYTVVSYNFSIKGTGLKPLDPFSINPSLIIIYRIHVMLVEVSSTQLAQNDMKCLN